MITKFSILIISKYTNGIKYIYSHISVQSIAKYFHFKKENPELER